MSENVVSLFQNLAGQDISARFAALGVGADVLDRQRVCLRNLFFIGKVDNRNSAQCQFARYILLALSIVMVSVIGFKFLAALQFGRSRKPEDYDKFVICQVPCYTEGEESLRNCLDSLTRLKYDDKRKLLFVICDGMIVGSGNDKPTPQIVLDILGADPTIDPEPLSFQSIGDGSKQVSLSPPPPRSVLTRPCSTTWPRSTLVCTKRLVTSSPTSSSSRSESRPNALDPEIVESETRKCS